MATFEAYRPVDPETLLSYRTGRSNAPTVPPATPPGMEPYFFEEFTGTTVDTTIWGVHNNSGYGSQPLNKHWFMADTVSVSGSTLTIDIIKSGTGLPAGKNYRTGALGSRDTYSGSPEVYFPRYGRYEFRARIPHAQGLWPGFWLRHRNGASSCEVDINEYFHSGSPGHCTGTLWHNGGISGGSVVRRAQKSMPLFEAPVKGAARQFHTWAVDMVPEATGVRFRYYQNGVEYINHLDPFTDNHWSTTAPPLETFDIAITSFVGGAWVGDPDETPLGRLSGLSPGRCAIGQSATGYPGSCTTVYNGHPILREDCAPAGDGEDIEIDYIRVWKWVG